MKKIHIINSVSVMDRAGQETLLMNILRNMDRDMFQIDFLCSLNKKGDYDDEIVKLGGNVYYLGDNKWAHIKYASYFYQLYLFYCFYRKHKYIDIIHIHSYHSFGPFLQIIGAKLAGIKHIILHSHNSQAPHPNLHFVFRFFSSFLNIKRLACSDLAAKWMYGSRWREAAIVNNGIILSNFKYRDEWRNMRYDFGISDETLLIGHVGRYNYQKNHIFLLDVFKEIVKRQPKARLMLVGRGELEKEIEKKISDLHLIDKVIITGVRSDVNKLLSCFDIFLFPSLFEGLAVVLIEAQAAGLPCIISDTITRDVKITDCVDFISLNETASYWAERVINASVKPRAITEELIRTKGYDIITTVNCLSNMYKEILEK